METYIFKLTIEEINSKENNALLADSILNEIEQKNKAKKSADEINLKIKQKRIEVLKPILDKIREQITEPLGIKDCFICKNSNWLHKDSIKIQKCFTSSRNMIEIFVETPYKKDSFGNVICFFEPKIKFTIDEEYTGSYTYNFTTIEDFFRVCKKQLTDYHLYNKKIS